MDDVSSVPDEYREAIVEEAKQWLLIGCALPAFILLNRTITSTERDRIGGKLLGPSKPNTTLLALDYMSAKSNILKFAECDADFETSICSETNEGTQLRLKHSARVLVEHSGETRVIAVDLCRDEALLRRSDARKLDWLRDLLERAQQLTTAEHSKSEAHQPLRDLVEKFLLTLLQRPPSDDETALVLSTVAFDE